MSAPFTVPKRPGEEFFQRRLQRAAAVTEAEASPEVLAFRQSVPWMDALVGAVPATAPPAERSAAMLAALYRLALGHHRCPAPPASASDEAMQMLLWSKRGFGWQELPAEIMVRKIAGRASGGRAAAAGSEQSNISQPLHLFGAGLYYFLYGAEPPSAVQVFAAAVELLEGQQALRACQAQLEQLAAQHGLPQLTAEQLLCTCHLQLVHAAMRLIDSKQAGWRDHPFTPPAARLSEMAATSVAAVLRLEPSNPRSHTIAAYWESFKEPADCAAAERHLRTAAQLAREQGSNYWLAFAASRQGVMMLLQRNGPDTESVLQQASRWARGLALPACFCALPQLASACMLGVNYSPFAPLAPPPPLPIWCRCNRC
jgi:hypothetical protein